MLTPRRRRGVEFLDDPATDPAVRERSLGDVRMSNILLGGTRAVVTEVSRLVADPGRKLTLLDVGTGVADIPGQVAERLSERGISLTTIGVDEAPSLAQRNARVLDVSICADARHLPFATNSVDVVTCSQMLHHLRDEELAQVLAELHRVARMLVIVSDLRRSWFAACGFWSVSWLLGFHAVTRHDGFVSVLRGFTPNELRDAVQSATRHYPQVRRHLGYRITASWPALKNA